jgi:chromate transporter
MKEDSKLYVPSFRETLPVWLKIGLLSFGGPAGQIALMHKIIVDERRWLTEEQYLHALNFCMLLPGPEAMQLATYAGWRLHGWRGGLAAGLLFVIPGSIVILGLSILYATYGSVPLVASLFLGVKAAVLAIVVEALLRVARRALKTRLDWSIAAAAFVALFLMHLPFPIVILAAALIGLMRPATAPPESATKEVLVKWQRTAATAALWLVVWLLPVAACLLLVGPGHVLSQTALFFSKLAIVTFGGAYAVLAYMAQQAVEVHGWLSAGEMVDGLGLAETTPGPLILVTEFVGFFAGYRQAGGLAGGIAAAVITLWVTFAPSFLMIFVSAPYIERLRSVPRLGSALSAITAAVVGVILNLTIWFGVHVLFSRVQTRSLGMWVDLMSVDIAAVILLILAAFLLLRLHMGIVLTLVTCAASGLLLVRGLGL